MWELVPICGNQVSIYRNPVFLIIHGQPLNNFQKKEKRYECTNWLKAGLFCLIIIVLHGIASAENCSRVTKRWQGGPDEYPVICIYGFAIDATDMKRDFIVTPGTFDINNNMNQVSFSGYDNGNQLIWGDISGNGNCYYVANQRCGYLPIKDECAVGHISYEPKSGRNSGIFSNVPIKMYFKGARCESGRCFITHNNLQVVEVGTLSRFYSNCR